MSAGALSLGGLKVGGEGWRRVGGGWASGTRVPVGGVESLDVELQPRPGHEHLGDVLEEGHPVRLGADVVVDVRALVEPLHEPVQAVRDELEVGIAKVLYGDDARVAQGAHALREACERSGLGGGFGRPGQRARAKGENGTMERKK